MALLDEIRKAQVLNLLGERLQGLLDVPTSAARFMASPTDILDVVSGKTAMPREKGFAEGATGLPQRENLTVLDPANRAYMEGYSQGEPFGYAAMALPFASAGATKLSDKLVQTITKNPNATAMNVIDYASMPFGNAIVSPKVAKAIQMPVTLPTDEVFQKAVANTPNAQITDEGLLLNVMRKQKPQQAMTESVRGGVFYLPEGASQMKYYGGSNSYGGTEKIAGETLFKNPLFVKGATGGKAPEAAYEQLVGKEGFKEMQSDISRILSEVNSGGNARVMIDGVATDSPVAKQIIRLGGNPQAFIDSMQPKLNAQKQALEKASKEEVLPNLTEYDMAKMDLDATVKMIDEAKSLIGKKIGTRQSPVVEVENFLDKYAPDLSGYGNYIIDNSKQGNQLRYALQEAAVAQKVRDAGYDSVIGHSKKKGEPTISEIFDVRESHYPDAYGDFQLMPKFESLLGN